MTTRHWADYDDDDEEGQQQAPVIVVDIPVEKDDAGSRSHSPVQRQRTVPSGARYSVRYVRRTNINAKILYDLYGRVLIDDKGQALNVWRKEFKQYLDDKTIRAIRVPNGQFGYSYFATNKEHQETMRDVIHSGTVPFNFPIHVYCDDPRTILPYE